MNEQVAPLPREVSVAVIGAGTMGSGIALVAATAGHSVLIYDGAPGAAEAGCKRQRADLERLVTRGKLTAAECQDRLTRLQPVESLSALAGAGLVIEAIVENLDIKVDVLRKVEELTTPKTILATNTSSLSVTALSSRMDRPGRVVGMHFFNPAPSSSFGRGGQRPPYRAACRGDDICDGEGLGKNTCALRFISGLHRQPCGPAILWRGIAFDFGARGVSGYAGCCPS